MIRLQKEKNWYGHDNITISTNEGVFEISLQGNGDLYWSPVCGRKGLDFPNKYVFFITEENYQLYDATDKLYTAVKNNTPYSNSVRTDDDFKMKKFCDYDDFPLFRDDKIQWHSDDFEYNESSVLSISKEEDKFKIEMSKSNNDDLYTTYAVRIRNSGSKYTPFNVTFMNMYYELLEYGFDYHQMHIEEYLYDLKKKKIRKI